MHVVLLSEKLPEAGYVAHTARHAAAWFELITFELERIQWLTNANDSDRLRLLSFLSRHIVL